MGTPIPDFSDAYLEAFNATLEVERGYSNDPRDSGGRTIYGISERWHPRMWRDGPPTLDEARLFYLEEFWEPLQLERIDSPDVQMEVFDSAVNCGPRTASRWLQRAYNVLRPEGSTPLVEDGWIGHITAVTVNRFASRREGYKVALVNACNVFQGMYYFEINDRHNVRGWLSKRVDFSA